MKRRVQRGRAHCDVSREEHDPTLREPCGPAPESSWVVASPDSGYQTWRSRHRQCPDTRTRKSSVTLSRVQASLSDQPVFRSAREPEIRRHIPKLLRTSAGPKANCSGIPPEQKPEGLCSVSFTKYETLQNLDPICPPEGKPSPSTVPPHRRAKTWTRPEERGVSRSYLRHRKDRPEGHLFDRRTSNSRRNRCP